MGITRFPHGLNVKMSLAAGGTAGNFTVTGITTSDSIRSVWSARYLTTGAINSVADLTSEFSVTAANTINNTGGTNTTYRLLYVLWFDADA